MKRFLLPLALLLAAGCSSVDKMVFPEEDLLQYVDPKIGSGGHGHVFVGANVPFGAVQLGPTSIPQGWDWCSGYHDSDSTIIGFSHTHLSGTGIGDLFDVTVMPVIGKVTYARGKEDEPASGLWSYGLRSREVAKPGYYSIPLERYGILAEMTATERVGMHRYTFPATREGAIVFDLENGGCWDSPTMTSITQDLAPDGSVKAIEGYRFSTGWAKEQRVFFHAEFSRPVKSVRFIRKAYSRDPSAPEDVMYARVEFGDLTEGEQILLKVAISGVSIENARENMAAELPGWDFDATANAAMIAWDSQLDKVRVEGPVDKKILYTALYHSMNAPSLFCDVNWEYRGADGNTRKGDTPIYTTFSLWDTYRAAMPLMSILQPDMMPDIINTMIRIWEEQGKLPVWHLMGCETDCMVGNPGAIVVADAIVKGIPGFDKELAYKAIKSSLMLSERGQGLRREYGYIPSDIYISSVSNDMEYAIADAAAAAAAEALGYDEDAEYFRQRSLSYRNYMDQETHFARGRFADGSWRTPFDPWFSDGTHQDFVEGNAWQYTWLAPHDFEGLVSFWGSKEALTEGLDLLFSASEELAENASPDISGMIGQYAHGNEPSHHIIYFYTMAGARDKAADKVREVLTTLYSASPDGLSGNEDVGQMSSWYILSAMGFYQVEPASKRFWFGSPLFDKMRVKVQGGYFDIIAHNNSPENKHIDKVKLNGKSLRRDWVTFDEITSGGTLEFFMKP